MKFLDDIGEFVSRMVSEAAKHSGPKRILQEAQVDLGKCSELAVRTQALDVNIVSGETDRCVIQLETGDNRDNDSVSFSTQIVGNSVMIMSSEKSFYGTSLSLMLPSGKDTLDLKVQTKDGDVSIGGVTSKSVDVETESGDISISGVACEGARLFSRNGDVFARDTAASGGIDMRSVNGDVIR